MSKLEVYNIWQEQIIVPSEICLGSRKKKKSQKSHHVIAGWVGGNKQKTKGKHIQGEIFRNSD